MIAFIDDHRGGYEVEPICKVLPIAPSTYHAQVARRSDPGKSLAFTRLHGHRYAADAAAWNAAIFCSGVR